MIDLRFDKLPSHIECGGVLYELHTDFRPWLTYHELRKQGVAWAGVFKGEVPSSGWVEATDEFMESRNATPHDTGGTHERVLDYILDGDYIVAAFQQAYGIDLTSIEYMHWHRFIALMNGLPDDTKLSHIISYRGYRKSNKKHEQQMAELKSKWRLPDPEDEETDDEVVEWANEFFGD